MNINYLKAQFPNYKITDASNRTNDEIIKISSICMLKKDILVVIERNSKNNDYFDMIEMLEDINHKKTKYILLNDDNYYTIHHYQTLLFYTSNENLMEKMNAQFVLRIQMVNISFVVNVPVYVV